jgi:hypothetical protein
LRTIGSSRDRVNQSGLEEHNGEMIEDKNVINQILQCKGKIIALLKKELKLQREELKSKIESLVKEKEELNLRLQRHLIIEREQAHELEHSKKYPDTDKLLQYFEKRLTDSQDLNNILTLKRRVMELAAEKNQLKIENEAIQSMRKRSEEKIKFLNDELKRITEELMSNKDALLQVFNILLERQDNELIEKIDRIVHEVHKPVLDY